MKVFSLSFYSDFSNAFANISNALTFHDVHSSINVNYCTHLSGYIVGIIRGSSNNIFLPIAVRFSSKKYDYSKFDLVWAAEYLIKTGVEKQRAIHIAQLYIAYFLKHLSKNRPDKIIISGDSRVQSRSLKIAASYLGINVLFFEQGPFGTSILDPRGVNINASFADGSIKSLTTEKNLIDFTPKRQKISNLRMLDYILEKVFLIFGFCELKEEKSILQVLQQRMITKLSKPVKDQMLQEFDLLLIGQVPTDANMLLHNDTNSFYELLRRLLISYPDAAILFREHPLYRGGYDAQLYNFVAETDNISISQAANLDADIQRSKNIVVVNSLTGLEVMLRHRRPVVVLGDAIYGNLAAAKKAEKNIIDVNKRVYLAEAEYRQVCNWFCEHYMKGHFRDENAAEFCKSFVDKLHEN